MNSTLSFKSAFVVIGVVAATSGHAAEVCINYQSKGASARPASIAPVNKEFVANISFGPMTTAAGTRVQGGPEMRVAPAGCNDATNTIYTQKSVFNIEMTAETEAVTRVEVDYCDWGGIDNFANNFAGMDFVGDFTAFTSGQYAGTGSFVDVLKTDRSVANSNGRVGTMTFTGEKLKEIVFGGSEIFVNRICISS